MIEETTPKYITELKTELFKYIDNTEPKYFKEFRRSIDIKFDHADKSMRKFVEKSVNELALMIKDTVATKYDLEEIRKEMVTKEDLNHELSLVKNEMATKEDTNKILKHIGAYEIRAKNIEDILLHDHKPRIKDLEKEVFA